MARVRVVLEGEPRDVGEGEFTLGDGKYQNWITPTAPHVVSVEEIKPRLEDLPVGTVFRVKNRSIAGVKFVVAPGRYFSLDYTNGDTFKLKWLDDDVEIIYLPKE